MLKSNSFEILCLKAQNTNRIPDKGAVTCTLDRTQIFYLKLNWVIFNADEWVLSFQLVRMNLNCFSIFYWVTRVYLLLSYYSIARNLFFIEYQTDTYRFDWWGWKSPSVSPVKAMDCTFGFQVRITLFNQPNYSG